MNLVLTYWVIVLDDEKHLWALRAADIDEVEKNDIWEKDDDDVEEYADDLVFCNASIVRRWNISFICRAIFLVTGFNGSRYDI